MLRISSDKSYFDSLDDSAMEDPLDEASKKFNAEFMYYKTGQPDVLAFPVRFMVVVDAGSTGSRGYVYSWLEDPSSDKLPDFQLHASIKLWPGISAFTGLKGPELNSYLRSLWHFCGTVIKEIKAKAEAKAKAKAKGVFIMTPESGPPMDQATPVYLFATAGMRLVPEAERKTIMNTVFDSIMYSAFNFQVHPSQVRIIEGQLEGILAWLSVNYLTRSLPECPNREDDVADSDQAAATLGLLDIGGGSMQMAYEPSDYSSHDPSLFVPINFQLLNGKSCEYRIFSKSLLGMGMNEARRKYHGLKQASNSSLFECYPSGYAEEEGGSSGGPNVVTASPLKRPSFVGTGKFAQCCKTVKSLLKSNVEQELRLNTTLPRKQVTVPEDPPWYFPKPKSAMTIFGVAEYWNTVEDVFHLGTSGDDPMTDVKINAKEFFRISRKYCTKPWSQILEDVKYGKIRVQDAPGITAHERLKLQCFKSSWLLAIMEQFFHIKYTFRGANEHAADDNDKDNGNGDGDDSDVGGFFSFFSGTQTSKDQVQMIAKNRLGELPLCWAVGVPILYYSHHKFTK